MAQLSFNWRARCAVQLAVLAAAPLAYGQTQTYDVVIYGGTAGGVAAAVQAARMGKTVALVEPTSRIGGLTTNGLGATDVGNANAIGGLARDFYIDVGRRTGVANSGTQFNFEPSEALNTYNAWLAANPNITLMTNTRLDLANGVVKTGNRIDSIRMEGGLTLAGKVFIDAGYEGDVMAGAGVSYTIGREANSQYGETTNGVQKARANSHQFSTANPVSAYNVPGNAASGLLPGIEANVPGPDGSADSRVQSYNFRLTMTKAADRRAWVAPANYNASNYELLRRQIVANNITSLGSVLSIRGVHGGKYDVNNNGAVSTDFIGQNYNYAEASHATRAQIIQAHRDWQQGLMFYLANDAPNQTLKDQMNSYGLAADEFTNNDGWSEQLYIREGRRMVGRYVMTDRHVLAGSAVPESIGLGSYTLDSHHVQRYVDASGNVRNEGDVQVSTPTPYGVSYQSLTPQEGQASNLLVTSSLSASHAAYGSIRMEPVFMETGQAAAAAASLAIDGDTSVQGVTFSRLRRALIEGNARLEYPANLTTRYTAKIDLNSAAAGVTNLRYDNSGSGVAGVWDGTGTENFVAGDLTYTKGGYAVAQTGVDSIKLQGNYNGRRQNYRSLNAPMEGEIWLSFLAQNSSTNARAGLSLNATNNADPAPTTPSGSIGHSIVLSGTALQFLMGNDATTQTTLATAGTLALNQTHLIVGRLSAGAGNDTLSLWADPVDLKNLGAPLITITNQDLLANLTSIGLLTYNTSATNAGGYLDAIRLASDTDAYSEVTGVPEPTAAALLAAAAGLLARRPRRNRNPA